jgi:hypothetical protein
MTRIESIIVHAAVALYAFTVTVLLVLDPLPTLVMLLSATSLCFVFYLADLAGFKPFAPKRKKTEGLTLEEITPSYENETTVVLGAFGHCRPITTAGRRARPSAVIARITPYCGGAR